MLIITQIQTLADIKNTYYEMKVHYLFIIFFIAITSSANAEEVTYSGSLNYANGSLNYQIEVTKTENKASIFFTSIEMNAYQIPALNVNLSNDSLNFYIVSDVYTYEYKFKKFYSKTFWNIKKLHLVILI